MLPPELMDRLAKFAQWYRRMVSGNTDILSLFSQMRGWSRRRDGSCGATDDGVQCRQYRMHGRQFQGSLNQIMRALGEAAHE